MAVFKSYFLDFLTYFWGDVLCCFLVVFCPFLVFFLAPFFVDAFDAFLETFLAIFLAS